MGILATWSDKGGTGKTTVITSVASCLGSKPLRLYDFDPQGDAIRWASRNGLWCRQLGQGEARGFLKEFANAEAPVVADLPPGSAGLPIAALAELCIIPTRPGDADLVALGRALKLLKEAKAAGNPDLKIAVVLSQARVGTVRTETVEDALKRMSEAEGFRYLGRLSHRVQIEAAAASGQDLMHCGDGAVAHEFRGILEHISNLLNYVNTEA